MVQVIVQHHVADYDTWYPVFVEHGDVRRKHGATGHAIYRTLADPNDLVIVNEFATREGAEGFMSDPSLPEAMHRAGVNSEPKIWLASAAESKTY